MINDEYEEEDNTSQTPPLIEAEFSQNLTQKVEFEPNILSLNKKQPAASLKLLSATNEVVKEHPLFYGQNFIGRDKSCEICLRSSNVSKRHACIEISDDDHFLFDCNSLNKTKRNNKVLSPDIRYELVDGVFLTFADVSCLYSLNGTNSKRSTVSPSSTAGSVKTSSPPLQSTAVSALFANYLPQTSDIGDRSSVSPDLLDQQEQEIDDEEALDSVLMTSRRFVEDTPSVGHISGHYLTKGPETADDQTVVKETQSFHEVTRSNSENSLHLNLTSSDEEEDNPIESKSSTDKHDDPYDSGTVKDVMSNICDDQALMDILHGPNNIETDQHLANDTSPYIDGFPIDIKAIKKKRALASLGGLNNDSQDKLCLPLTTAETTAERVSFKETPDIITQDSSKLSSNALPLSDDLNEPKTGETVNTVTPSESNFKEQSELVVPESVSTAVSPSNLKTPSDKERQSGRTARKISNDLPQATGQTTTKNKAGSVEHAKRISARQKRQQETESESVSEKQRKNSSDPIALTPVEIKAGTVENAKRIFARQKRQPQEVESKPKKHSTPKRETRTKSKASAETETKNTFKNPEEDFVVKPFLADVKPKNAKRYKKLKSAVDDLNDVINDLKTDTFIVPSIDVPVKRGRKANVNVQQNANPTSDNRPKRTTVKDKLNIDSKGEADLKPILEPSKTETSQRTQRKGRRIRSNNNDDLHNQQITDSNENNGDSVVKEPKEETPPRSQRKGKQSNSSPQKQSPAKQPKPTINLNENNVKPILNVSKTETPPKSQKRKRSSLDDIISSDIISSPRKKTKSGAVDYRIAFTGITEPELTSLTKIVTDYGATVEESPYNSTHLIAENVKRTAKFLCSVARGIPILLPEWLKQSKKQGYFLDSTSFILHDSEAEKKFGFRLKETLKKVASKPLFSGYSLFATASVKPPPEQMKDIVECAGGKFLTSCPTKRMDGTTVVIVSCDEDKKLWPKFEKLNLNIVSAEFILTGLLKYEVDVVKYGLHT